ncbi:MAG: HD domain-containing protein [Anaerolineae bacterium]|nr:HD domain-containing protein [Anaerolineae bacterium]
MPTLEDAIALAVETHRGQVDKAGKPYILHPLRVMFSVEGDLAQTAAVLHDVVEDSDTTLNDLREMGYAEEVVHIVDCLTRRDDETYMELIARAKSHPVARQVKLADLRDNMDLRRFNELTAKDLERFQRYRNAWNALQTE